MAAKDAIDVWRELRDYMLSRIKNRYDTVEDAKQDMNSLYEYAMQTVQENYDRFFEKEIFQNLDTYKIEILGERDEVIEPDEIVEEEEPIEEEKLDEEEKDMFADEEVSDEELNEEFGEELK